MKRQVTSTQKTVNHRFSFMSKYPLRVQSSPLSLAQALTPLRAYRYIPNDICNYSLENIK